MADATVDQLHPEARGIFPEADRFGSLDGSPPHARVFKGHKLLGFVYRSSDVIQIPAYSGRPINTLIGLDTKGRIAGLRIIEHHEPILAVGISERDLAAYVAQYRGQSAFDKVRIGAYDREGYVGIDGITGATITTMVENATIMRSAGIMAEHLGLPLTGEATQGAEEHDDEAGETQPPATLTAETGAEEPIWMLLWQERKFRIAVLCAGLMLLSTMLVFQDWLVRRPTLLKYLRTGFLVYTVFFIGWYALAQLSVVNVLTFAHAAMHNFSWDTFLADPMLFILWSFVAMTVLLWGRGVYCGWLCPYGALQELLFQGARRLRIPHFEIPDMVHERLWAVKYLILLGLFGVSLQSLDNAQRLAEVEPFKTAMVMRFAREWPFVLYAAGLLAISVFNRKFFCRYMCPLGAALTFPARFRIFDWLRRRKECGRPCQTCAAECEVGAIRPTGEINANECHYCLDCQVTYWSSEKCPPLIEKRRKRELGTRARAATSADNKPVDTVLVPPPGATN